MKSDKRDQDKLAKVMHARDMKAAALKDKKRKKKKNKKNDGWDFIVKINVDYCCYSLCSVTWNKLIVLKLGPFIVTVIMLTGINLP